MRGIDISAAQTTIDFEAFKNSGGNFVIVRAGFGTSVSQKDKAFTTHINGALKAGLKVGVYWFIYASNIREAYKNADACAEIIKDYRSKISPIVWCDFEYDSERWAKSVGWKPTPANREEIIKAFLDRIEQYGYNRGVYVNPDYLKNRLTSNFIANCRADYIWLAAYTNNKPDIKCDMWQSTSQGVISGYNKNVDIDTCYNDSIFNIDDTELKPEDQTDPEEADLPQTSSAIRYKIQPGDTLWNIALKYNTTYIRIAKDNNIHNPNLIYAGNELVIYR